MQLPVDLLKDQEIVLRKILSLLSASVDVLSSDGHLNAMSAMEMSQMVVQAMWDRDSPLKQIPHFTPEVVKAANDAGVQDIFGFMEAMDPSENKDYAKLVAGLGLSSEQLRDAAGFTNEKYPDVSLAFEVEDREEITAGVPATLAVTIERDSGGDDDEEGGHDDEGKENAVVDTTVHAPFFPGDKTENWWLVVGDEATKSLLAIKRITFGKKLETKLEYVIPNAGKHELTLYLMSDSYVGVDQAPVFEVDVKEGEDDDEEEEEEDGDAEADGE